ncbi:DUF1800 domain-containing protein [Putridiphycobacter roseus]|nr:DUF1800 family protein [Putridiphycobacter roseus]
MKQIYLLVLFCTSLVFSHKIVAQKYIGAGNAQGVTVTSSHNAKIYPGIYTASAQNTLQGEGLIAKKMEATRFLTQAGFGGTLDEIDWIANNSIEKWLANQLAMSPTYLADSTQMAYDIGLENYIANGGDSSNYTYRPDARHTSYAWWTNTMLAKDQLRQRAAYALSQIMVISFEGDLAGYGIGVSDYYDILIRNAFGNYKTMLSEISEHVAMGAYLSHLNNPKSDTANNIHPDENYAREIMQLFSIGLFQLNIDGSQKLDGNGNPIPTYDNNDIKELAKVFTGLSVGAREDGGNLYFYLGTWAADFKVPMMMYEDQHEAGQKTIIDGHVIPAGQTGKEDIADAIDHLFNHANVGPFMAKRLIQQLVKSNPSPNYIQTVAEAFNDNGEGVRGDMKKVFSTILMHPEARTCAAINDPAQGKLREPVLRYTQFARFFGGNSPHQGGRYFNYPSFLRDRVDQAPLHAQTVFNFYSPAFSPNGPLANANLVGPEFEIHNTRTSIGYTDMVYYWVESEILFLSYSSDALNSHITTSDLTSLTELAKDEDALIDYLDIYLCHGQLSQNTRSIIKNQLNALDPGLSGIDAKIRLAVYTVMISPDYVVLK